MLRVFGQCLILSCTALGCGTIRGYGWMKMTAPDNISNLLAVKDSMLKTNTDAMKMVWF